MINIGICGSNGRMGKELALHLRDEGDARIGALVGRGGDVEGLLEKSDVVIDFSSPLGTKRLLEAAQNTPKPLVIGTTGLDGEMELLRRSGELMPVFYATNMSLGVAVLNHLAHKVSALLRDFDVEILEMHHCHKKDAPSGTAMTLAQNVARARNLDLERVRISGRDGITGERSKDAIAVMSLRGGDIVGRHTVGFYGDGEFLELHHTATSRSTFAKGAIKIAKWLYKKEPKFYSIDDFLGL